MRQGSHRCVMPIKSLPLTANIKLHSLFTFLAITFVIPQLTRKKITVMCNLTTSKVTNECVFFSLPLLCCLGMLLLAFYFLEKVAVSALCTQ